MKTKSFVTDMNHKASTINFLSNEDTQMAAPTMLATAGFFILSIGKMIKKGILLLLFPLFLSCGGSPPSKNTGALHVPAWVNSVDSVYNRTRYVSAVGYGSDRVKAEENALASLAAFFGQSIQVDRTAVSTYHQAVINGVTDSWIDNVDMSNKIRISASMDNLIGAEIREVWFDSRDTFYAVAVMEKARSAQLYNEVLLANLNIIKNLAAMTPLEKNSLDGVIRYRFAGVVADINSSYENIVRLLDAVPPEGIVNGNNYRLEAYNIAKTIPIGIVVTNDRAGRIFGAFSGCFSDFGFETSSGNSRYMLTADINISPVSLSNNPNIFSRIELGANLADTEFDLVLLPFNFNSREGHISQAEAENRCIAASERSINEDFRNQLSVYLTLLMPKNLTN